MRGLPFSIAVEGGKQTCLDIPYQFRQPINNSGFQPSFQLG